MTAISGLHKIRSDVISKSAILSTLFLIVLLAVIWYTVPLPSHTPDYIGLNEAEFEVKITKDNLSFRVVQRDGMPISDAMFDFRDIHLTIDNGIVTDVWRAGARYTE